jgi:hypothetical protein
VDAHHRRTDAHACHFGVKGALIGAIEMADISGGAAHVEADDLIKSCHLGGLHSADHATCRAGEDRVLALKHVGGGEPA